VPTAIPGDGRPSQNADGPADPEETVQAPAGAARTEATALALPRGGTPEALETHAQVATPTGVGSGTGLP
jgi:hypothetical protein